MSEREDRSIYIRPFAEIGIDDIPSVGGKNASLGEMYRELTPRGVKVPDGFAVTADAYWDFLKQSGLDRRLRAILDGLDTRDTDNLRERGRRAREAILEVELPADLERAIVVAYERLSAGSDRPLDVAVRSSATAEDLPDASFAGQQETYLNVQGGPMLLETCRRSFASLFTDRAISYRVDKGFDHFKVGLSVGVQLMVRSDLAASGVMFSIDTETGFRDAVLINASYGLGENVVQGSVNPDEYYVFKPTLKQGFRPILQKMIGTKEFKLIYDVGGGRMTRNVPVPPEDRARFAIGDDEILQLARWACLIEDHYSAKRGRPMPMDMEWAKDGRTGELFIVQARPETVQSQRKPDTLDVYRLKSRGRVLVQGRSVGEKIGRGPARVIKRVQDLHTFRDGEVLVTDKTDPDWEPTMKKAAAIVTNRGGRTCHAAIVSRELGLPAVVGTERGTEVIRDGQSITVSCAEGDTGFVYDGLLDFEVQRQDLRQLERPKTHIMMNVGNPEEAFRLSFVPNDGVGLAREEFIISTYIKVHPLALLDYGQPEDPAVRAEIDRLTAGYDDKPGFFVDKLAQGVAMIGAAFYPKDVIVRLSDYKTNEYANLVGGRRYRAEGGESHAGLPRRLALLRPALPQRLRPRMPRHEEGARRDGADQRQAHGPLLQDGRGGPAGARRDGGPRAQARRERPGGLRHVRDPQQRHPRRRVRRDLRRVLDRLQRPDPARPRRGPRLGDRGAPLRRTGRGREEDDRRGHPRGPGQGAKDRDLRPGAERLSRVRPLPGRAGDQ